MVNMLVQELGAEKQWSLASHLRINPPWRVATTAERNPHSTLFGQLMWKRGGQFCRAPAAIAVWIFLDVSLIDRSRLLLHSSASQICNIYITTLLTLSTHLWLNYSELHYGYGKACKDDILDSASFIWILINWVMQSECVHFMSEWFDQRGHFVYHPFDYYCGSNPKVL